MARNVERPAQRVAVIVPLQWGFRRVSGDPRIASVDFPRVGVEPVIADVLKGVAVELARAGLGGHFDGRPGVLAHVSAVVRGRDAELGDGVQVRISIKRPCRTLVGIIPAVDFPVVVLHAAAVERNVVVPVDAHVRGVKAVVGRRPWHEQRQRHEVPTVELEVGDLRASHHVRNRRRFRLNLRNVSGHGHFLRDLPNRHLQVHALNLADRKRDPGTHQFLETGRFRRHHVVSDRDSRHGVNARRV